MEQLRQFLKEKTGNDEAYLNMQAFFAYLVEQNQRFNLTTIVDEQQAEQKHFLDSLSAWEWVKGRVLDIGAGAGFPSIPLAIVKKEAEFLLCDSVGKKVSFLEEVINKFGLENCKAKKSRVEDLDKTVLYDTIVVRGVAALNIIAEYALPFLKVGGRMLAYKAAKAQEELDAAQHALNILGGKVEQIKPYTLFYQQESFARNLIIIKKIKETPPLYPRGGNKPRSKPL